MKKVLIIDSHQLFRDFLKQKLADDQIEVIITQENRDTYSKLINVLPNLIILDIPEDRTEVMEFLEKKGNDPNTVSIPVIVTGPSVEKSSLAALAKYGVIKYFPKPIQFDVFFDAIGNILNIPLSIDTTPCVLDLHRNGNVVFIELALGLNREKIALIQYMLTELIEQENIESPRIIIMLTNLEFSFVDGYNLEFLIENVISCPRVHNKNVKILSLSTFVREMVDGHSAFDGIEVSSNLPKVLNSVVDTSYALNLSDVITDRILFRSNEYEDELNSIETRFSSDGSDGQKMVVKNDGTVLSVAIIDSDIQIQKLTKASFEAVGANCSVYSSGKAFLDDYDSDKFSLIVLDVMVSDSTGLTVLQQMNNRYDAPPVVVYSQNFQKDLVVKALSLGAKNYLTKPQKPNVLVQKCLSVLKAEF
ncbi:MAG: response regulator [Treponema sp.]|nr:response regulator [Treponema sp.]